MFTDYRFAQKMRAEQRAGNVATRADLFSAGTLATAPGGHGTEYGIAIPTIAGPDEARAFVDARIAEGSDYLKIVYDDGATYRMHMPTISRAILKALVDAAHARGKLAVVHIGSYQGAVDAPSRLAPTAWRTCSWTARPTPASAGWLRRITPSSSRR